MKILEYRVGKNRIKQIAPNTSTGLISVNDVAQSWESTLSLHTGGDNKPGLRTPQLGALFAIKAHWTVSNEPATIVMPTGTGKTETMIATVVSEQLNRTIIVVPNSLLRKQTANKFLNFGILQTIGVVNQNALPPSVTLLESVPRQLSDLQEILYKSNVIVTTMSLLQGFSESYLTALCDTCDGLIIDEAHHIPAETWSRVKWELQSLKCLQFTATPFRNDAKKVDGRIIYNFPLSLAQEQGYFEEIKFVPIWEFDEEKGDFAIAAAAVEQLERDLAGGHAHIILVRAKSKSSADRLHSTIYEPNFGKHNPVLVHSGISRVAQNKALYALKNGDSRIVVCVDMFGEGIDIPNLKIAAVHDKYKSLPITLQFIGRFARTRNGLGNATVITNLANDELDEALQELYSQDSDWNVLLPAMSQNQIDKDLSLQELVGGFDGSLLETIDLKKLSPAISLVAYNVTAIQWNPDAVNDVLNPERCKYTVNHDKKVIVIIERLDTKVRWTSLRNLSDRNWHLHLVYWNCEKGIAFINSTSKNHSFCDKLANALLPRSQRISGESVFRCLHGIKRIMLGTVGLNSAIDGPIRYRMFAGLDIGRGITESQRGASYKSNLFGVGYKGNGKVSIGCSYRGTIWLKWVESIDYWVNWCNEIGALLHNNAIETSRILDGALIPEVISERPKVAPYGIEWPLELDLLNDNSTIIEHGPDSYSIYEVDIGLLGHDEVGPIRFYIGQDEMREEFELQILDTKHVIKKTKSTGLIIRRRGRTVSLVEFFQSDPPLIKFVDQSMLEGNIHIKLPDDPPPFNKSRLESWDWTGTNIQKESQGISRDISSIQYRVIQHLKSNNEFSVIFDDDDSGEIADVVAISDEEERLVIHFYHCKYSMGKYPGSRISDLYEVCGQAEKSVKWCQDHRAIIDRLIKRENLASQRGFSRFEIGDLRKLREIKNKMRVFPTTVEIFIVQPGVDSTALSDDMLRLLSATSSNLMDTYSIDLKVICS